MKQAARFERIHPDMMLPGTPINTYPRLQSIEQIAANALQRRVSGAFGFKSSWRSQATRRALRTCRTPCAELAGAQLTRHARNFGG